MDDLERILETLGGNGLSLSQLELEFEGRLSRGQLRRRLVRLEEKGRARVEGQTRARRWYRVASTAPMGENESLTQASRQLLEAVVRPERAREPVGYDSGRLRSLGAGSRLMPEDVCVELSLAGDLGRSSAPAGTYDRMVLERLLIELSHGSSALEGNTYSLLETERLLELGEQAQGRTAREATMILNHKRAIEMMLENISGPWRYSVSFISNLHSILLDDLLPDRSMAGRVRHQPVGITGSVYTPLASPTLLRDELATLLHTARKAQDPFERSFILLSHLSYLQPFLDGNKRTARLMANLPLLEANLCPLTFQDVDRSEYLLATLVFYETGRSEPLVELYRHAYLRSVLRFAAIEGELPLTDPFRLRHRDAIYQITGRIARELPTDPVDTIDEHVDALGLERPDALRLGALIQTELEELAEHNFSRYWLSPSDYERWRRHLDAMR